ncbi:hypothetical protein PRZ48_009531 [Zasmidium cellare]|uniref:Uncharacterized protein n=1 Tax=Zasmidium cellare TaxID=395010 RepID=A0ABR0ECC0_ZASCE|nr:hypothetical protein PRZ48_009531 [Zasmidium cellare]
MDCTDQTYRANPYYDFVTIDDGLCKDEAWFRASLDDIQQHPSLTQLRHLQDGNGSPSGSNGSSIAYRADGLERSSLDQTPFPEGDLISDQFFNSYCNTSPAAIDEPDGMTAEQTRRSRWMENAAQGSEPDKDGRLARRQAQNREA